MRIGGREGVKWVICHWSFVIGHLYWSLVFVVGLGGQVFAYLGEGEECAGGAVGGGSVAVLDLALEGVEGAIEEVAETIGGFIEKQVAAPAQLGGEMGIVGRHANPGDKKILLYEYHPIWDDSPKNLKYRDITNSCCSNCVYSNPRLTPSARRQGRVNGHIPEISAVQSFYLLNYST